jgi:tRNA(fMet)-specific endonuclease VapC
MWLLDTNAWIAYLEREPNPVKNRIATLPESTILLCDVVKAELIYGAYKSSRIEQNLAKLDILFALVNSLPFDGNAAREFGEIRAYLARQGTPIASLSESALINFGECLILKVKQWVECR